MVVGGWWMVDGGASPGRGLRLCRGEAPKQSSFTPTLGFEVWLCSSLGSLSFYYSFLLRLRSFRKRTVFTLVFSSRCQGNRRGWITEEVSLCVGRAIKQDLSGDQKKPRLANRSPQAKKGIYLTRLEKYLRKAYTLYVIWSFEKVSWFLRQYFTILR